MQRGGEDVAADQPAGPLYAADTLMLAGMRACRQHDIAGIFEKNATQMAAMSWQLTEGCP